MLMCMSVAWHGTEYVWRLDDTPPHFPPCLRQELLSFSIVLTELIISGCSLPTSLQSVGCPGIE